MAGKKAEAATYPQHCCATHNGCPIATTAVRRVLRLSSPHSSSGSCFRSSTEFRTSNPVPGPRSTASGAPCTFSAQVRGLLSSFNAQRRRLRRWGLCFMTAAGTGSGPCLRLLPRNGAGQQSCFESGFRSRRRKHMRVRSVNLQRQQSLRLRARVGGRVKVVTKDGLVHVVDAKRQAGTLAQAWGRWGLLCSAKGEEVCS
jgi:hypothetical protein